MVYNTLIRRPPACSAVGSAKRTPRPHVSPWDSRLLRKKTKRKKKTRPRVDWRRLAGWQAGLPTHSFNVHVYLSTCQLVCKTKGPRSVRISPMFFPPGFPSTRGLSLSLLSWLTLPFRDPRLVYFIYFSPYFT